MAFLSDNLKGVQELGDRLLGAQPLEMLRTQASSQLDQVGMMINDLDAFLDKIGTEKDTKAFRENMRKKIKETSDSLLKANTVLQQIDKLTLNKKQDMDLRNKVYKRLVEVFAKHNDQFQRLTQNIAEKERRIIDQVRKSTYKAMEEQKTATQQDSNQYGYGQQQIQTNINLVQELDYNEALIEERQRDLEEISQVTYQLKDITVHMAKEVDRQGQELEIMVGNIASAKEHTKKANKALVQTAKGKEQNNNTQMIICIVALVICVFALILIL